MELVSFKGLDFGSVVAGVISIVLASAIYRAISSLENYSIISRSVFYLRNIFYYRILISIMISLLTAILIYYSPIIGVDVNSNATMAFFIALSALTLWQEFSYARIGLSSAQKSVASGTNYDAALRLCRDGFWFLGTGAAKLTSSPEFENTIRRCNHTGKMRILLSTPDNNMLEEAERQANVTPGSYKRSVLSSLRKLKQYHEERSYVFEVRFYPSNSKRDVQDFRMMFIDHELLLLSYNAYGMGDGRNAPQLVLTKSRLASTKSNFYFPYENYYDKLWAESKIWDFIEYV
jgi:hypothetical protein